MSLNMSEYAIILYIWPSFVYALDMKYNTGLHIPWYSYNDVIMIVTNAIVLELVCAPFVNLGALKLTILSLFNTN